jgi:Tfp pilus assembly major pilin PilA
VRKQKGISLIALIITIIVIIILAAIVIGVALNTPENANRAKFASDISEVQHAVKVKLAENYNQFVTNPSSVDLNTGFTRVPVNSAPESFNSFALEGAETGTIGYLVKLDTIKMENLTIGQGYKTATEVSFGVTDAFVYDVEGEVFYALGHKYDDVVYYSLADIETGSAEIIPPEEEGIPGEEAFETTKGVNKPELTYLPEATTYAITYNGSNNPEPMPLAQAKTDTSWYDYSTSEKKWANIKTTGSSNEAYWVWIPRYAYKIDTPRSITPQTINIKFLIGTSDIQADGTALPTDYIVHPAFTFGGKELTGIWVAKFEASSSNPNKVEGSYYTGGGNDTSLQVRVIPNVYSWRNITTGNAQTVTMNMTSGNGSVGTTVGVDTHQMKNSEWGAVAYLTQSIYGKSGEVWINPCGDYTSWRIKTGYAGNGVSRTLLTEGNASLSQYNTGNGPNASTTGNLYGVYDMSGGAWEYITGYIDNGTGNIETFGSSNYFASGKVKAEYAKYYDVYEPGDSEMQGGQYFGAGILTIWNADKSVANNTIRKGLTDATYAKMINKKGDAMFETSNVVGYFGKNSSGNYDWLKNATDTSVVYTAGWNGDYQLYGHGPVTWFMRGGIFDGTTYAGIYSVNTGGGDVAVNIGFRPVLVAGDTL